MNAVGMLKKWKSTCYHHSIKCYYKAAKLSGTAEWYNFLSWSNCVAFELFPQWNYSFTDDTVNIAIAAKYKKTASQLASVKKAVKESNEKKRQIKREFDKKLKTLSILAKVIHVLRHGKGIPFLLIKGTGLEVEETGRREGCSPEGTIGHSREPYVCKERIRAKGRFAVLESHHSKASVWWTWGEVSYSVTSFLSKITNYLFSESKSKSRVLRHQKHHQLLLPAAVLKSKWVHNNSP